MKIRFKIMTALLTLFIVSQSLWVSAQKSVVTIISDDFESGATPTTSGAYDSELFYNSGSSGMPAVSWANHLDVVEGMGYNGTKGLYMHCDKSTHSSGKYRGAWLTTREFTLESGEVAILRYKFKILNKGTYDGAIARFSCIGGDVDSATPLTMRNNVLAFKNGSGNYEYSLDEWYTIECVITTEDADNVQLQMTNENHEILGYAKITRDVSGPIHTRPIFFIGEHCDLAEAVMDDVSITLIRGDEHIPAIWQSTISDGEKNVSRIPNINILFDTPLKSEIDCIVEDSEGSPLEKSSYEFGASFRTVFLKFNSLLEREESYTVKIVDAEKIIGQIVFTTEKAHLLNADIISIDKTEEGYVKAVINIEDPFLYPEFSGVVMAVLYRDSKMVWTDVRKDILVPLNTGKGEFNITLEIPKEEEGAMLRIFLLDYSEDGFIPLHPGLTID